MGSAPSVVVVHSASMQEDREAMMAIFPDRFQVEKQPSTASESLHWEDELLTLILVSCTYAKGTYTTLVMDYDDIRQAAKRATLFGVKAEERVLSGTSTATVVKLCLPGGASLLISSPDSWKNEESRNSTITSLLTAAPTNKNGVLFERTDSENSDGQQQIQKRSTLTRMQRSASMPDIPSSVSPTIPTNRLFPSLRVQVLANEGKFEPYPMNTENGIPVETELFVGKLLLVMRPLNPEDDPYWNERIFSKKKRRVVMQMQGKLKYKPKGELYSGMEISDPMRLGLLASGLCNLLLKMSQQFNPQIHYSFGDDKERPHICFPASTFFEQLLVTSEGESPPPMGIEWEEPADSAQKRKAYKTKIDWNTNDTYSMSFHSMYLDFPSWSVVRLPIGRDVSLQTFWGNSSAAVVLYEVDESHKKHLTSSNKYLIAVDMKYLGKDTEEGLSEVDRTSDNTDWSEDQFVEVDMDASFSINGEGGLLPPMNDDLEEEDLEFFDTVQSQSLLPQSLDTGLTDISAASSHAALMRLIDKCCPCIIDVVGKKGKYVHAYAFHSSYAGKRPLLRTFETSQELLGDRHLVEVEETIFSDRLSPVEMNRRKLGLRYAEALMGKASPAKMNQFQKIQSFYDKSFLQRDKIQTRRQLVKSGILARAISDRQWIEEWCCITEEELEFYRLDKTKPYFRISLMAIVKVEPLPEEEWPLLPGYYFLSVETFGRTTCLMLPSEEHLSAWMEAIVQHRPTPDSTSRSMTSFTNHLIEVDEPSEEFLQRSPMWDCNKRKLLNCRKFSFRTPVKTDPQSTLVLAETALRKATSLEPKGPNDSDLIEFLDCVSALKEADAHSLDETQRLAFFLNIYHVMIMHAFLVLGKPDSSLKWLSYFTNIAYQCADDIFSLAELEHNIIRAHMSYPSQFLSRFVLPKSYYHCALTKPDIRINFALNCGSLSIPTSSVPLYIPAQLEEQLERVTRAFLAGSVSVKPRGLRDASVSLPRVLQWYADDFGDGGTSDILKQIEPYLDVEQQQYLKRLWNERKQIYDIGIWNVKFLAYSFECRFLTLEPVPTSSS